MQAFCNNKSPFYCKCFLVGFKAVSAPRVSEHVQRKGRVFQALTLEYTWDLNKNCITYFRDEISIIVRKSYNEIKCKVFILGQCSFSHLGIISDSLMVSKFHNGIHD